MCVKSQPNAPLVGRLWSLREMAKRFRACSFANVIADLRESVHIVMAQVAHPGAPDAMDVLHASLKDADRQFADLELSHVLREQWRRLLAKAGDGAGLMELSILIREMNNNLMIELSAAWFLMIPEDRRFVYEQPFPIFGQDAHDAFPQAQRDIAAAGRCYALDEWTACVVHLMRALEHPLAWLALRVNLAPAEYSGENWKKVIDLIEKKIREMEQLPRSDAKRIEVQFLSEAAMSFRWFKDAWRNDAAHGREHYEERSGQLIFLHISDFFRHIAPEALKQSQ